MKGKMMNKAVLILALALGVSAWTLTAQDQGAAAPSGDRPPGREGGMRGPGGAGGPGGQGGLHLLPPRAVEQLKLTADQQKQVAALEAEIKAKIEKILTPEQLKQLKEMRPPMRQGGMGGPGGRPGGQGGQGGSGGDGQPQRPPSE